MSRMILSRRTFLTGLIAAPIVVRSGLLMPVRPLYDMEQFRKDFEAGLARLTERLMNTPAMQSATRDFLLYGSSALVIEGDGTLKHFPIDDANRVFVPCG